MLNLIVGLLSATMIIGAANGADLCEYLDPEDYLGATVFMEDCYANSALCNEFAELKSAAYESGDNQATVLECSGEVCELITYRFTGTTDSSIGASCSIEQWSSGYMCAPGYYGTASSMSSHTCKTCPVNATCSGGGSFTCNDGYTANGDECCTDWLTTTRTTSGTTNYKYRTCGNSTELYHLYKCNEERKYYAGDGTYGENGFLLTKAPDSGYVTCTWNDSTNAPTKNSCTGCVACTTGPTYESTDDACYDRKITWSYKLYTDDVYGDYGLCTNNRPLVATEGSYYVCAAGCYGTPTSSTTGCTQCPTITTLGTMNYETHISSDALKLYQLATAENHYTSLGNSLRGATAITSCYANSGSNVDLGTEYITYYQDSTGVFYWNEEDNAYNCYWE